MTEAVRDSTVIDADIDTLMDVIADFEAYPQWQDEVEEVEVLGTDEDGWATQVRFVVDAKFTKARFTLAYDYTDTSVSWHLVEGDPIRKNDGAYRLQERGDGTTEVTYELELDPGFPLPSLLRRQAVKRIIDSALQGLQRRVDTLRQQG